MDSGLEFRIVFSCSLTTQWIYILISSLCTKDSSLYTLVCTLLFAFTVSWKSFHVSTQRAALFLLQIHSILFSGYAIMMDIWRFSNFSYYYKQCCVNNDLRNMSYCRCTIIYVGKFPGVGLLDQRAYAFVIFIATVGLPSVGIATAFTSPAV